MITQTNLEVSIAGSGTIHSVSKPFDQALAFLRGQGIKYPITARDLAYARLNQGETSPLSIDSSYTREGIVYGPNNDILIVSQSPLLTTRNSKNATDASRNPNGEFYLDAEEYYDQVKTEMEKSPQKRKVHRFNKTRNIRIPANRFSEDELTLFLFEDQAENYGDFLRDNNILSIPIWLLPRDYVNSRNESFIRQAYWGGLGSCSVLDGHFNRLSDNEPLCGVLEDTSLDH